MDTTIRTSVRARCSTVHRRAAIGMRPSRRHSICHPWTVSRITTSRRTCRADTHASCGPNPSTLISHSPLLFCLCVALCSVVPLPMMLSRLGLLPTFTRHSRHVLFVLYFRRVVFPGLFSTLTTASVPLFSSPACVKNQQVGLPPRQPRSTLRVHLRAPGFCPPPSRVSWTSVLLLSVVFLPWIVFWSAFSPAWLYVCCHHSRHPPITTPPFPPALLLCSAPFFFLCSCTRLRSCPVSSR